MSVLGKTLVALIAVTGPAWADGRAWRVETERGPIHVWVPAGYDPATAATVVFVHGYHTDVDAAWATLRLPEQVARSGVNAMFIAAAAPSSKRDAIVWPSVNALVATVAIDLGVRMPTGRLVAIGHSGAYRTLATWLDSPTLDTVVLLDAAYGEDGFARWVRAEEDRRLITIAADTVRDSDRMHRALPDTAIVDGLPASLPDARIIHARTTAGHTQLVTDGVALPLALRALGVPRVASR